MRVWFSPHGTEWRAETYEEALELERDALVEQYEGVKNTLESRALEVEEITDLWKSETDRAERLLEQLEAAQRDLARWLAWSGGSYPDDSPGDVITAYTDGTIILDDGITTWNPLRAMQWINNRYGKTTATVVSSEAVYCDCGALDWVEGDNGAVRCVQCGGYANEPGTSNPASEPKP